MRSISTLIFCVLSILQSPHHSDALICFLFCESPTPSPVLAPSTSSPTPATPATLAPTASPTVTPPVLTGFGKSLSISSVTSSSGSHEFALVGAPYMKGDDGTIKVGRALLYRFNETFMQLEHDFRSPSPLYYGLFGMSSSVGDSFIVIGEPGRSVVNVFDKTTYVLTATLTPEVSGETEFFGSAVVQTGNIVLVSSKSELHMFVFDPATGGWTKKGSIAVGNAHDQHSHAMDTDGNLVARCLSVPDTLAATDALCHILYLAGEESLPWVSHTVSGDVAGFGRSVAVSGNQVAIGVVNDSGAGKVLLYRESESWTLDQTIERGTNSDFFGVSVDIFGNKLVIADQSQVIAYSPDQNSANFLWKEYSTSSFAANFGAANYLTNVVANGGYVVSASRVDLYYEGYLMVHPFPDPTFSPTTTPTLSPSASPTSSPTLSPSASPTSSPTLSPSASPTSSPTLSPSASPTSSPTLSPSASPTSSPTMSPSTSPTASPTSSPTPAPIPGVSVTPTQSPTTFPTTSPTSTPTQSPTSTPTQSPTSTPTRSPTSTPTQSPTSTPTQSPAISPTSSPTTAPSMLPTLNPSVSPTHNPTLTPTFVPTSSPSKRPTLSPTISPTRRALSTGSPTVPLETENPTKAPTTEFREEPVFSVSIQISSNGTQGAESFFKSQLNSTLQEIQTALDNQLPANSRNRLRTVATVSHTNRGSTILLTSQSLASLARWRHLLESAADTVQCHPQVQGRRCKVSFTFPELSETGRRALLLTPVVIDYGEDYSYDSSYEGNMESDNASELDEESFNEELQTESESQGASQQFNGTRATNATRKSSETQVTIQVVATAGQGEDIDSEELEQLETVGTIAQNATVIAGIMNEVSGLVINENDIKFDPCMGRLCSGHGTCTVRNNTSYCLCEPTYRGTHCQVEVVKSTLSPTAAPEVSLDLGRVEVDFRAILIIGGAVLFILVLVACTTFIRNRSQSKSSKRVYVQGDNIIAK